ncbi:MAG TPA: hypothetical protein VIL79_04970 [Thermoleophilia bacterium]
MSSGYIAVMVFLVAALIGLLFLWRYARNVKQDLDAPATAVVGARGVIELSDAAVEQLRQLSSEPILLKQAEDGIRVQIEQRPMLPMMAFVGKEVSASLAEAAAQVTDRYGAIWVVLLKASDDGRVTLQRLA